MKSSNNKECRFKDIHNKKSSKYLDKKNIKQDQGANNLCEILSSDDNNEECNNKINDNFIIVELISYLCGNSKIISFYPSTNIKNSDQNKYLYHFYKKKKVKLYLCLNKKNDEIFIYQVQCKYTKKKKKKNDSDADDNNINNNKTKSKDNHCINNNVGHSLDIAVNNNERNVKIKMENNLERNIENYMEDHIKKKINKHENEHIYHSYNYPQSITIDEYLSSSSSKDIKTNHNIEKKQGNIEDNYHNYNYKKKMFIKKLFDSINCSYDLSNIEYTKLQTTDDKTLNSLKLILQQKINKTQNTIKTEQQTYEQKSDINHDSNSGHQQINNFIVNTNNTDTQYSLKNNFNKNYLTCSENNKDKNICKDEEKKFSNDNKTDDNEMKTLFLYFNEPSNIYMNQFSHIDQSKICA